MKRFHLGRWAIAGLGLVVLLLATPSSADNPPTAEKKEAPAAVPRPGLPPEAFAVAMQRQTEAEQFVREFQFSSSGVDLSKELKLTDDQFSKIDAIVTRLREETSTRLQAPEFAPGQPPEQALAQMMARTQARTAILERAKNDISAVLTPEQISRVEQIALQSRIRSLGMARALTSDPGAQTLNLTGDQAAKLQEAESKAQVEFAKEYEALREQQRQRLVEARKKVLSVLTPEQQAAYEKLVGKPLDVDDRALDYGVAGVGARMNRDAAAARFGRGGFRGAQLPNLPPPAANPAAPAPDNPKQ